MAQRPSVLSPTGWRPEIRRRIHIELDRLGNNFDRIQRTWEKSSCEDGIGRDSVGEAEGARETRLGIARNLLKSKSVIDGR
jgi:hypothetical protein